MKGEKYELFSKGWLQHMGNIGYFQHPPQPVGVIRWGWGGGYTEWGGISGGRTYISHVLEVRPQVKPGPVQASVDLHLRLSNFPS